MRKLIHKMTSGLGLALNISIDAKRKKRMLQCKVLFL